MAQFPLIDQASLVMIPGAYKEGKIYSQLPTDGSGDFTFTRGTDTATRVNEKGLIEKERVNLLLQSNQFDTTWARGNTSVTSGQSGYDGLNNAWLLTNDSFNGRITQFINNSGVNTFSVYAKASVSSWIRLVSIGGTCEQFFDLENGVLGQSALSPIVDAKIESVGGGWYRCSVTLDVSITEFRIYPADANINAGAGGSVYIQDAQLEQGLVATDYIETTTAPVYAGLTDNMPRLDYTDATCPSLLLEPSRTNILPYSEYFGAGWIQNSVTLDFGYLAPDGTMSATKVTNNGSGTLVYSGLVIDGTYARSIYARTTSGTGTANLCSYFGNTNNLFTITDEWQRFEVSSATTTTGEETFYAIDFRASGLSEIIIWGAQIEEASYPTSYIPTYGSTQTRAADVSSVTKAVSSEGSLFINVGGTSQPKLSVLGEYFDASTTENKVAIAYSSTALVISHNGSIVVNKTGTYDVSSLTQIQLGHSNGADQADSPISEFITFDSFLTNNELNALTQ